MSELLSLFGHAGNLWLARVMRVGARDVLASLSPGAGLVAATALRATRTRLWLAVIAAASALLLGTVKLALPEEFLPPWLTLGVFACFAVGSCAARPRNRMVWQSAAVVMMLGALVLALVGAYTLACVLVAGAARKSGRLEVAAL